MLSTPGIVFRGEPGIGKTRLATEAAEIVGAQARPSSSSVARRCTPTPACIRCAGSWSGEAASPGSPTARSACDYWKPNCAACAMDPVSAVPLLAPVLGVGPEHGYHPAAVEGRTLYELIGATVQHYVLSVPPRSAGLVIAEDVHWFDPSTIELLNSLLASADGRLLVVVTGREGDRLRTEWPITLFDLAPLTDEQSDSLIKR